MLKVSEEPGDDGSCHARARPEHQLPFHRIKRECIDHGHSPLAEVDAAAGHDHPPPWIHVSAMIDSRLFPVGVESMTA